MTTFRRYLLYQLPGWVLAVGLVWMFGEKFGLSAAAGVAVSFIWVAKDFAIYPLVRSAYDRSAQQDPARIVGRDAVVVEELAPVGYVRVGAELWKARSAASDCVVAVGRRVRVIRKSGIELLVASEEAR